MTTAFQASIRYPLIWIINLHSPGESEPIANKVHRKIKKMVRFTDWLRAHYETAYHYYLAEHLHEYGIGIGEIHDFLGLRVTGAKTLHISLYRKSWSEVYVDVIIRAYVDIFTGDESAPNRRKSVIDYRVRGYYDLYEKRCHLFQCFMPYRPEDDMDKLRLDNYLVPIISKNDLEDVYAEFVISIIEKMKEIGCEPLAFVEERVNYSNIAPSGFGTADMLIIGKDENGKGLLHIVDFKAGKGIFVDADHNSQMMLYALGGLAAYGFLYDIEIVRMSIIQPRLDNISTCEMSVTELEEWGKSIKPIAKLAYEGKGEQKTGDWCRFCRAKPVCKACADEALALCREDFLDLDAGVFDIADESDMTAPYEAETQTAVFKQPGLIPISKLAEILPTLNRISSWIEAVFAFVSSEAINHGVPIPGYKVVEGRSKRVFTDTKAVVDTAVQNGYTDLYKQTLITLTEFEKMMGKKKFNELLGQYVAKPPGKLALVPESDPREPVDLTTPSQEFSVLPDEE